LSHSARQYLTFSVNLLHFTQVRKVHPGMANVRMLLSFTAVKTSLCETSHFNAFIFFFFGGIGVWTQDFVLARQALRLESHLQTWCVFSCTKAFLFYGANFGGVLVLEIESRTSQVPTTHSTMSSTAGLYFFIRVFGVTAKKPLQTQCRVAFTLYFPLSV
jgi:hypothetical protein